MAKGKSSLQELMGSSGAGNVQGRKLSVDDLVDLLGDGMPRLQFSSLGRLRLFRALKQRFGAGFKSIPGVTDIIQDFDERTKDNLDVMRMRKVSQPGRDK